MFEIGYGIMESKEKASVPKSRHTHIAIKVAKCAHIKSSIKCSRYM